MKDSIDNIELTEFDREKINIMKEVIARFEFPFFQSDGWLERQMKIQKFLED